MDNKLFLPNVTAVCVDCVDVNRVIKVANINLHYVDFPVKIKILTHLDPSIDYDKTKIEIINIQPITSIAQYSYFIIKNLHSFIGTGYCLLFQYDGFILNPKSWLNEFYNYDYIGALWQKPNSIYGRKQSLLGNGGFSFRSKKILEIAAQCNVPTPTHEDWLFSGLHEFGVLYPDNNIAKQFSVEREEWCGSFGFHDFATDISNWQDKGLFNYDI